MLPKVATTIIHSTGRAAAAVHTQSHTFRNVLQLPGTSSAKGNPGSGYFNSNNGGNSRGSRFTHGYHASKLLDPLPISLTFVFQGASRAVTQANITIAVDDGSFIQLEDQEEAGVPPSGKKQRNGHSQRHQLRGRSLSQSQHERRLSVLKSIQQLHSHSKHVFEARCSSTVAAGTTAQQLSDEVEMDAPSPPSASPKQTSLDDHEALVEPSSPQSVSPPKSLKRSSTPPPPDTGLRFLAPNKDQEYTTQAVLSFLKSLDDSSIVPNVLDFNRALKALYETRTPGEPLTLIIQTYNALLSKDLNPDVHTYLTMIRAFIDRHGELARAVAKWQVEARWVTPTTEQVEQSFVRAEQELQSTLPNALSLFRAMLEKNPSAEAVPQFLFKNLLRMCASHGNFKGAIAVWEVVETVQAEQTPLMYAHLIQALGKGGEMNACKDAFDDFIERFPAESLSTTDLKRHAILVHNSLIEAYFRCGRADMAVDMLDTMLASESSQPGISTMTTLISGFCTGEGPVDFPTKVTASAESPAPLSSSPPSPIARGQPDLPTALSWFNRLLEQPHSPKATHALEPLSSFPTRPDSLGWTAMLEALAREAENETSGMTATNYRQLGDLGEGRDALQTLTLLVSRLPQAEMEDNVRVGPLQKYIIARASLDRAEGLAKISSSHSGAPEQQEIKSLALSSLSSLSFLYPTTSDRSLTRGGISDATGRHLDILLSLGESDRALVLVSDLSDAISRFRESIRTLDASLPQDGTAPSNSALMEIRTLNEDLEKSKRRFFGILQPFAYRLHGLQCTLPQALTLHRAVERAGLPIFMGLGVGLLNTYGRERRQAAEITSIPSITSLKPEDWITLIDFATEQELGTEDADFGGLLSLLNDAKLATVGQEWATEWPVSVKGRLVNAIASGRTADEIRRVVQDHLPEVGGLKDYIAQALETTLESAESSVGSEQASTAPTSPLVSFEVPATEAQEHDNIPDSIYIDLKLTKTLNEFLSKRVLTNANTRPFTNELFALLKRNVTQLRRVPSPATLSQLAAAFGRAGELDRIYYVYHVGQKMLRTMEGNKKMQSESWFIIEDGMVIALCQAGQPEKAHVHRSRMLEMGGAPSADAYGGLVLHVKDTTDDTSNAMELYQEAIHHGVEPNVYLYNNIISKLAKARKADKALELFEQMKASRFSPTPITYGAVIGACARVGDVASAEILFQEMSTQVSFRPRVPPFNTMMQLYTTTKPDRERSLWYFEEMQRRGVSPTEYTYKLLMDTYVLEPIDVPALQATFAALVENPKLRVQSTHYATLINAYGCVLKDLASAQSVFSSVPPSVLDALVFEALVNVLVAHRRMDLAPGYVELMNESGIHMTAYVVNGLIKGYSAVGDIERSREIFEGTVDPPVGVAGMHNHVGPHLNGNGEDVRPKVNTGVSPLEPVYREPSTWESIVRAELGAGHRDRALALVERMKTRQYPEAVVNRVQGIMVDHSQVLI